MSRKVIQGLEGFGGLVGGLTGESGVIVGGGIGDAGAGVDVKLESRPSE